MNNPESINEHTFTHTRAYLNMPMREMRLKKNYFTQNALIFVSLFVSSILIGLFNGITFQHFNISNELTNYMLIKINYLAKSSQLKNGSIQYILYIDFHFYTFTKIHINIL